MAAEYTSARLCATVKGGADTERGMSQDKGEFGQGHITLTLTRGQQEHVYLFRFVSNPGGGGSTKNGQRGDRAQRGGGIQ